MTLEFDYSYNTKRHAPQSLGAKLVIPCFLPCEESHFTFRRTFLNNHRSRQLLPTTIPSNAAFQRKKEATNFLLVMTTKRITYPLRIDV